MARDAVTITDLSLDAGTTPATGTTIDPANGVSIAAGGDTSRLLLEISQTAEADKDITIVAGTGFRAGLGSLVLTLNAATSLVAIESARFAQADGSIHIDFETGTTGTVKAYRLPH